MESFEEQMSADFGDRFGDSIGPAGMTNDNLALIWQAQIQLVATLGHPSAIVALDAEADGKVMACGRAGSTAWVSESVENRQEMERWTVIMGSLLGDLIIGHHLEPGVGFWFKADVGFYRASVSVMMTDDGEPNGTTILIEKPADA